MSAIAFSTLTYDLSGCVLLQNVDLGKSDLETYTRRVTRYATLDSGAYLDDAGYSDGDRTITVSLRGTEDLFDALVYLIKNYGLMYVFLPDGAFTGAIASVDPNDGNITVSVLIKATA